MNGGRDWVERWRRCRFGGWFGGVGAGVAEGVLGSQRALWGRARERKGVVEDGMGERLELRCRFQMGLLIRRFPFDGSSVRALAR